MIALLFLAALTPEALDLGNRLAATGTLATVAPLLMAKETEEMVAAHPELSAEDKAAFRRSAEATSARLRRRIAEAEGKAFAENLSVEDLRVLVAAADSEPARRMRSAMPKIMMQTVGVLGSVDFKGEAVRDFCAAQAKLCPNQK